MVNMLRARRLGYAPQLCKPDQEPFFFMNQIHPTAILGVNVVLGSGNVIGPFVVIAGNTVIGDGNWFGSGVKVGAPPEVRSVIHGPDWLDDDRAPGVVIGDRNVLREDVQVHGGWQKQTVLNNDVFIMNGSYIAHDCALGDGVTLASGVALGGHVDIGPHANIGLGATVHQRRVIGSHAMVGMSSVVTRDVPPFVKAFGAPCRAHGVNVVGMQRAELSDEVIAQVARLVDSPGYPKSLLGIAEVADFVQAYIVAVAK